ncbi:hypothetical protein AERO8C_30090 [Aeromonas veronii]|uniref:Uncharacterized protein n=1 Tax=Aeromonas veronii TaxID=654 RepID=A0A653L5G5_AERVE|nr:hypothetical protein AERO8C_30090 [Aeromonas veronii]
MGAVEDALIEQGDDHADRTPHRHPGADQHGCRLTGQPEDGHDGGEDGAHGIQRAGDLQRLDDDEGHQYVGYGGGGGDDPALLGPFDEDIGDDGFLDVGLAHLACS